MRARTGSLGPAAGPVASGARRVARRRAEKGQGQGVGVRARFLVGARARAYECVCARACAFVCARARAYAGVVGCAPPLQNAPGRRFESFYRTGSIIYGGGQVVPFSPAMHLRRPVPPAGVVETAPSPLTPTMSLPLPPPPAPLLVAASLSHSRHAPCPRSRLPAQDSERILSAGSVNPAADFVNSAAGFVNPNPLLRSRPVH